MTLPESYDTNYKYYDICLFSDVCVLKLSALLLVEIVLRFNCCARGKNHMEVTFCHLLTLFDIKTYT
jgi:hypothetical protein